MWDILDKIYCVLTENLALQLKVYGCVFSICTNIPLLNFIIIVLEKSGLDNLTINELVFNTVIMYHSNEKLISYSNSKYQCYV